MRKLIIIIFTVLIIVILAMFLIQNVLFSNKSDISWVNTNIKIWYIDKDYHLCRIDTNGQNRLCTKQKIKDRFVFSPDGKFIAFVSWSKNENHSSLYIINTEDFSQKGLVLNSGDIADTIEWSPDSNYLAYALQDTDTNNDGKIDYLDERSLYLVSPQNNENILLGRGIVDNFEPFYWFKDGEHLYFERTKIYSENDLREQYIKINIKNKKQEQIAEIDWDKDPRILDYYIDNNLLHFNQENGNFVNRVSDTSSDGRVVYYERGSIFVDGKLLVKFEDFYKGVYDQKFNSGFSIPQWLPDNKYIIFEGACSPFNIFLGFGRCIFIADSATGRFGKLTEGRNVGVYRGDRR
jgi:Tol biopolymer transport system component